MFDWLLKLLGLRKKETVIDMSAPPITELKKSRARRAYEVDQKDEVSMYDIMHKVYPEPSPVVKPVMSQGVKPTEREFKRCERVRREEPTTRRDIVQNITHVHEDKGFGLLDTMVAVHVLSELTGDHHHHHPEQPSRDSFGGGQSSGGGASREYEDNQVSAVSSIIESSIVEASTSLSGSSDSFGGSSDSFGGSDDD